MRHKNDVSTLDTHVPLGAFNYVHLALKANLIMVYGFTINKPQAYMSSWISSFLDSLPDDKNCVDTTVAISTIAALNVMLVIGVSMVTIVFMKIRAAWRRNQKAGSVYSRGSHLSMHSRGTRSSHRSNRY